MGLVGKSPHSEMASKKAHSRKVQLAEELEEHFDNYKSVLVVECDNVGSNQLHEIRKNMRGKALIYCGKNTQMRRVLRKLEEAGRPELEKLRQAMKLNVALVFTNGNLADVKKEIEENKLPAAARAGSVAQCAVVIPAGVTSLEPTQTNFLQALNIGSKITKGMIEIIAEVRLFEEGDKVDGSGCPPPEDGHSALRVRSRVHQGLRRRVPLRPRGARHHPRAGHLHLQDRCQERRRRLHRVRDAHHGLRVLLHPPRLRQPPGCRLRDGLQLQAGRGRACCPWQISLGCMTPCTSAEVTVVHGTFLN